MLKKLLPFSFLLLSAIFIFTTSSAIEKREEVPSEVALPLTNYPILPDVALDYDIFFPAHAQSNVLFYSDSAELNREITPDGATLGRVLFYDKKLSFTNQLSCASCHKQEFAFTDNRQFSFGNDRTLTNRNTLHLNDLIWARPRSFLLSKNEGLLNWDASESLTEELSLDKIRHQDILGKGFDYMALKLALIPYYAPLFEKAFGDEKVTEERIGNALAQFIHSIASFDSKYDKVIMGEPGTLFTSLELEGGLLMQNHCSSNCHAGSNFCSTVPMNNGLQESHDPGDDVGVANYTGKASDIGKFKSPSLRNVEMTAPYMHDGRFNTLEEVLDFYSEGVKTHVNADFNQVGEPDGFTGFNFTEREKEAIIAFLKTLTTPGIYTNEKWSDPFESCVNTEEEQLSAAINVYPNPVAENFTIDLGDLKNESVPLKMFDHNGALVWENIITNQSKQTFKLQQFPKGIYLLQMEIEGVLASKKLLIR